MEHSWKAECRSNDELIYTLRSYGLVKSKRVEAAMRAVDRGHYSTDPDQAYCDRPHGIGCSQTISAPHMHAMCLELLLDHAVPGAKVLDVGSGSGYLTACLGHLVGDQGKVIGIDRIPELVEWGTNNIRKDSPQLLEKRVVEIRNVDGWEGVKDEAPFDAIHVGAAAATLPQPLVDQLRPGGRLIIPVGRDDQELLQVDKQADGSIVQQRVLGVRYVPLVPGLAQ